MNIVNDILGWGLMILGIILLHVRSLIKEHKERITPQPVLDEDTTQQG